VTDVLDCLARGHPRPGGDEGLRSGYGVRNRDLGLTLSRRVSWSQCYHGQFKRARSIAMDKAHGCRGLPGIARSLDPVAPTPNAGQL